MLACCAPTSAQEVFVEASATASSGDYAPLWLSANRQGIVSPYANSAYERVGYSQEFTAGNDSTNAWKFNIGADVMLTQNAQSNFFIHQLYGEVAYKKLCLTVGQKERMVNFRNNRLTSGGMSQGINAQPIPEALLYIDYFSAPYTNHWLHLRGRIGYGKTTDQNWQKEWVAKGRRHTSNTLYHEKAFEFKIGREEKYPLIFEFGLQMMTQFGGTSYDVDGGRSHDDNAPVVMAENLNAFWHAFWPMGSSDAIDGMHPNAEGNIVGSYNLAFTWKKEDWYLRAYYERVFEDQSMLTVQYGLFDHLAGFEAKFRDNPYVSHVLVEHISTKDQAGPIYHDATVNIPESYTGRDNYYNHGLYTGWQNWGMGIGHPLLTSPIYNTDHHLVFRSTRIRALHLGIDGNPTSELAWRAMATITRNWGTYSEPYDDIIHQQHYMAELSYAPQRLSNWSGTLGIGLDHGKLIGNSFGAQCTIRYNIPLKK